MSLRPFNNQFEHIVISHPDKDHYYGFLDVFKNLKLKFKTVYHNGVVVMAQKLEQPRQNGAKWDIHKLVYNSNTQEFELAR